MMITKEEILDIARLACLIVPDQELDDLTQEMNRILDFAEAIDQADDIVADVADLDLPASAMREDVVIPSLPAEDILRGVSGGEDGFFAVDTARPEGGGV